MARRHRSARRDPNPDGWRDPLYGVKLVPTASDPRIRVAVPTEAAIQAADAHSRALSERRGVKS